MSSVVLVTPETHPRDVGALGLDFGGVSSSPLTLPTAHAMARMIGGEYSTGGKRRVAATTSLAWAPREQDEAFAEFGVRCRRALSTEVSMAGYESILVVTHPRNLAVCHAWTLFGEAGLSPLFDYTRAEGATSFTGLEYRLDAAQRGHPVPFGR